MRREAAGEEAGNPTGDEQTNYRSANPSQGLMAPSGSYVSGMHVVGGPRLSLLLGPAVIRLAGR